MINNSKVVVLSGGSGNTALVTSLINDFDNVKLNIIVNAYDSGKSTGICRHITDTLGVSDIRKNHFKLYKLIHKNDLNEDIVKFYKSRLNLTKGKEAEEAKQFLVDCELNGFIEYVERFFSREESKNYDFKDFSITNIVYAEMYNELGYEKTNNIFTSLLRIPEDIVILNSFDNVYIQAVTESGNIIEDEGDIVEYKNSNDKISNIKYNPNNINSLGLNPDALEKIKEADYIIISTGTFWSSIYPTFDYLDFYKCINNSKAKKIWFINSEEDKDSYGVDSNMFINKFEKLGMNLNDFSIIENISAVPSLKMKNDKYNIEYEDLKYLDNGINDSSAITEVLKRK